jgi:hypothetical protein
MAAGTLLIMDEHAAGKASRKRDAFSAASSIDPNAQDLIEQLLERWKSLQATKRRAIAISLLQRLDANAQPSVSSLTDAQLHARLLALTGDVGRR